MDRDNHWDRIEKAYRAIVEGVSEQSFNEPCAAVQDSYAHKIYDEEFSPVVISENGRPVNPIRDNDALIFFNIRADRARQNTHSMLDEQFEKFQKKPLKKIYAVSMTGYENTLPASVAFSHQNVTNCLAEVVA